MEAEMKTKNKMKLDELVDVARVVQATRLAA